VNFDELRDAFPELGFALYALEPRGVVTLEVHEDGQVFSFIGATAQEAIDTAFPPQPIESVFD
jgi:hypothetical protein